MLVLVAYLPERLLGSKCLYMRFGYSMPPQIPGFIGRGRKKYPVQMCS